MNQTTRFPDPTDPTADTPDFNCLIDVLRRNLISEPGLKSRLDDKFLRKFLRARKFDPKRALELVKSYYKQRIKYPDFYKIVRYSSINHALQDKNVFGIAERKDPEGRTVFLVRNLASWDPNIVSCQEVLANMLLFLELILEDEETQLNGIILLADVREFGLRHLRVFTPSVIIQTFSVTFNSFPAKFKAIYGVDVPYYFKILYAIAKPFLSLKFRKRIKFYSSDDTEKMHSCLPKDILPEEFGGTRGSFDCTVWKERLRLNDQVLEKDSLYGYTNKRTTD